MQAASGVGKALMPRIIAYSATTPPLLHHNWRVSPSPHSLRNGKGFVAQQNLLRCATELLLLRNKHWQRPMPQGDTSATAKIRHTTRFKGQKLGTFQPPPLFFKSTYVKTKRAASCCSPTVKQSFCERRSMSALFGSIDSSPYQFREPSQPKKS